MSFSQVKGWQAYEVYHGVARVGGYVCLLCEALPPIAYLDLHFTFPNQRMSSYRKYKRINN